MNAKFLIAWVIVFVGWMAGSFIVHGVLLHADYTRLHSLFRPEAEAQAYFPLMLLAHASLSGALAWIYSRGVEAKPWLAQGLRFGVALVFLVTVPMYTIYFVVQPMPGATVVKQIVFDGVLMIVLCAILAFIYRRPDPR